jgi:hypothetical protein
MSELIAADPDVRMDPGCRTAAPLPGSGVASPPRQMHFECERALCDGGST